jgi:cytochrome c biogenesis factor
MSYKEIQKNLPKDYCNIAYECLGFVRQEGLNKYHFKEVREALFEEAKRLYDEHTPFGDPYRKKLSQFAAKQVGKCAKKTTFEQVGNILMIVALVLSVGLPFLYGVSFGSSSSSDSYSQGIYLYMKFNRLFFTSIYMSLGMLFSVLIQKIDKKKKTTLAIIVLLIAAVLITTSLVLYLNFPEYIMTINFPVAEGVCIVLTLGGYLLEDIVAQKAYKKFEQQKNNSSKKKD